FVLREKKHLAVDLVIAFAAPRVKATSELLSLVLMLVFIGFMLVYSYQDMAHTYATGELEPTIIRTPVYMVMAGMVLGLCIFMLQIVRELCRTVVEWKSLPGPDAQTKLVLRSPAAFLAMVLLGAGVGVYLLVNDWPGLGLFLFLVSLLV